MTYEQQVTEVTGETGTDAKVTVELMRDADQNSGCLDHLSAAAFKREALTASEVRKELQASDPECYAFYVKMAS